MYGNPVKSPFPSHSTGRGEAAVNNRYIARGGKWESGEEKIPGTLNFFFPLTASCLRCAMHSVLRSSAHPECTQTHRHISPLYVSISFAFLPSQSCVFHSCVPGGRLLKARWNWMPPSHNFPLTLAGDFILLEWGVTAHWLIVIQNINICLWRSALALKRSQSIQNNKNSSLISIQQLEAKTFNLKIATILVTLVT